MNTLRTVGELRAALTRARRARRTIGLVPTMGAFHEGHLSLMRRAREQCDVLVVSLFVNPAQFNDAEDLKSYPRDEARDSRLAAELGVDVLFAPSAPEIYPDGFATTVTVGDLNALGLRLRAPSTCAAGPALVANGGALGTGRQCRRPMLDTTDL